MNPDNTELLKQINTPADLRKLQVSELPQVCDEIRHFIINTLAHNPGHFGSSMGAVELTVAWGLSVSTLITLIIVPTVYAVFAANGVKRRRRKIRKALRNN